MGSRSGPFPDFTGIPLALMGATMGAAVGMFLGGLGGLVMRLLESQATGVVVPAVGVVVGSVVLQLLGLTQEATRGAVPTAGVPGVAAAGLAWWSRHRSVSAHRSA